MRSSSEAVAQHQLPNITVITVVRNAAATLPRAIDSLVAQAYPNLEYIVLDALSTDGTVDIIKHYTPHIAFWKSEKDDGPNDAYNQGIARASGDIIALLNADDWYEPGILRAVGEAFALEPALDMVTAEAEVWQEKRGALTRVKRFAGKAQGVNPLASPIPNARFYRKHLFERHGPFLVRDHKNRRLIASDLEHLLRLSQHPIRNTALPRVGYHYCMHEGSLTMGADAKRERQMYEERAWIAGMYLEKGTLAPYAKRLKRWHRRGKAREFWWALMEKDRASARAALLEGMKIGGLTWWLEALKLGVTRGF